MATKRSLDATGSPVVGKQHMHSTVSLVPATVSSPLGILDASALQFLLSSPTRNSPHGRALTEGNDRPASSELARAYGVRTSEAEPASHRRYVVDAKKRRKPVPSKLAPMAIPRLVHSQHNAVGRVSEPPNNRPVRLAKPRAVRGENASTKSATSPVEAVASAQRNQVVKPSAHPPSGENGAKEGKLKQEIQWIYAHLPVRRLANTKCSLALRVRVFTETLQTNLSRGALRDALLQWRWCISKQKEVEASRLRAFDRLVDMFSHALRDQLEHRFTQWRQLVAISRDLEFEAAAISIQHWVAHCLQRREAQQEQASLSIARALAVAVTKASMIQRAFRGYAARQLLKTSLQAVRTIQRFVRAALRRQHLAEQREATRKMDELYMQLRREQRLQLLLGRSRANQASKIIAFWRQYAAWREQLAMDYVHALVDQVEFFAAVQSIQRHIRGYQCRFRMKRKLRSAVRIQRAWRQYSDRQRGRQVRRMMVLTQNMAASCLQRTFQRNRERKKHREAMHKSTRPMYMRALTKSDSFRKRFYVPIVKSAVSVIQSTWRRHVRHQRWKAQRDAAACRIQHWQCSVRVLYQWQQATRALLHQHRQLRRLDAAQKLQRWVRACFRQRRNAAEAMQTRQLVEMLNAVMAIQRYYRRKHDPWRRLLRIVVQQQLPPFRRAASRISHCWRQYSTQKRRVLERLQGQDISSASLSLSALQALLQQQQRELERQNRASRAIQRAYKRHQDKLNGKLLLKRYKLLFHKELRRKQQRSVIHGFLEEKQQERAKRMPLVAQTQRSDKGVPGLLSVTTEASATQAAPSSSSSSSSSSVASPATATTTPPLATHQQSPMDAQVESAEDASRDDSDVVKCWSDEFQCHYWFNPRTGESTWA